MVHELYQFYIEKKGYGALDVYFNGDVNTNRRIHKRTKNPEFLYLSNVQY